jgi:hypothetical protein
MPSNLDVAHLPGVAVVVRRSPRPHHYGTVRVHEGDVWPKARVWREGGIIIWPWRGEYPFRPDRRGFPPPVLRYPEEPILIRSELFGSWQAALNWVLDGIDLAAGVHLVEVVNRA